MLNEEKTIIEYKGRTYSLVFNMNVMELIQQEFKSLDKWFDMISDNSSEVNIGALITGMMFMLNEGIEIDNEDTDENTPMFTKKQVGRILTAIGLDKMNEKIQDSITAAIPSADNEKNA